MLSSRPFWRLFRICWFSFILCWIATISFLRLVVRTSSLLSFASVIAFSRRCTFLRFSSLSRSISRMLYSTSHCSSKLRFMLFANPSKNSAVASVSVSFDYRSWSHSLSGKVSADAFGVSACYWFSYCFRLSISNFSVATRSLYSLTWASTFWTFFETSFLILAARLAYLRVFNVSSMALDEGEIHASMTVMVFPPKDSLSNRVNFESR